MNYKKLTIFIFIFLISASSVFAQNDHKNVQKIIADIFDLCKTEKFEEASVYFVYRGSDKARDLKSEINYKDRKEKSYVDRICKKINSFLKISDSYGFGKTFSELEKWGIANKQEVFFESETQKITTEFVFVKLKDKYLLAEVN